MSPCSQTGPEVQGSRAAEVWSGGVTTTAVATGSHSVPRSSPCGTTPWSSPRRPGGRPGPTPPTPARPRRRTPPAAVGRVISRSWVVLVDTDHAPPRRPGGGTPGAVDTEVRGDTTTPARQGDLSCSSGRRPRRAAHRLSGLRHARELGVSSGRCLDDALLLGRVEE